MNDIKVDVNDIKSEIELVRLRPHHLLCTQGYSGRGYDDAFVENMTAITNYLRGGEKAHIEIVFTTDDICSKCPHMVKEGVCKRNAKVKRFDQKVIDYFGIKENRYIYQDLIEEINAKMTSKMMDDICSDCEWFPVSSCKKNILKL